MIKYLDYIDKYPDQSGKTIIVTGANSGFGLETTRILAYKNAKIIMACRSQERANNAINDIKNDVPNAQLEFKKYDQSSYKAIDEFVESIKNIGTIDCLVLNAGIYHPKKEYMTAEGFTLTMGTNFIGVYYLVNKLTTKIEKGEIKRIVIVSSVIRHFGKVKNYKLVFDRNISVGKQYAISKQMDYEFACYLSKKFKNKTEIVLTHPGIASTGILNEKHSSFSKNFAKLGKSFIALCVNTPLKSALSSSLAVVTPEVGNLDYFCPRGFLHCGGKPMKMSVDTSKIKSEQFELAMKENLGL